MKVTGESMMMLRAILARPHRRIAGAAPRGRATRERASLAASLHSDSLHHVPEERLSHTPPSSCPSRKLNIAGLFDRSGSTSGIDAITLWSCLLLHVGDREELEDGGNDADTSDKESGRLKRHGND